MERAAADVSTTRSPDDHRTGQHRAIASGRDVIGEHVVAARDEIDELHLAHRPHSHVSCTGRSADYCDLRYRRIDYTLLAKPLLQPVSDLEGAAICTDVLAETEYVLVALHFFQQGFANCLEVGDLRHRECPSSMAAR